MKVAKSTYFQWGPHLKKIKYDEKTIKKIQKTHKKKIEINDNKCSSLTDAVQPVHTRCTSPDSEIEPSKLNIM